MQENWLKVLCHSRRVLDISAIIFWWGMVVYVVVGLGILNVFEKFTYIIKYLYTGDLLPGAIVTYFLVCIITGSLVGKYLWSSKLRKLHLLFAWTGVILAVTCFSMPLGIMGGPRNIEDVYVCLFVSLVILKLVSVFVPKGAAPSDERLQLAAQKSDLFRNLFSSRFQVAAGVVCAVILTLHVVDVGKKAVFEEMTHFANTIASKIDFDTVVAGLEKDLPAKEVLASARQVFKELNSPYKITYIFGERGQKAVIAADWPRYNNMVHLNPPAMQQPISEVAFDIRKCVESMPYLKAFREQAAPSYAVLVRKVLEGFFYEERHIFLKPKTASSEIVIYLRQGGAPWWKRNDKAPCP